MDDVILLSSSEFLFENDSILTSPEHFIKNIVFVEDICAAAKGYEYLAEKQLMAGKTYE